MLFTRSARAVIDAATTAETEVQATAARMQRAADLAALAAVAVAVAAVAALLIRRGPQ